MENLLSKKILRRFHYINQNGICAYCGCIMNRAPGASDGQIDDNTCTLEHIIPRSEGGKNYYSHTIAVCHKCNYERSSFPLQFHQIIGIFLAKGLDGLYPISVNLYKFYIQYVGYKFRNTIAMMSMVS